METLSSRYEMAIALWLLTQTYARSNYLKSQQRWGRKCSGPTLTEELLAVDKLRGRGGNYSAWRVWPLVSCLSSFRQH